MKQTRFIPTDTCGLHVRETEDGQQSRTIEGKPIVFGVRSVNLTPWSETREVYEVLEPGCITNELLQRSDVILNLNHSSMVPDVLGRCKNGNGTLSLRLAGDHIECRCELPKTNNANDALELMKRGDITGMSFAFQDDYADSENGVSYERTDETHDGKEVWLRHVKRITGLYDVAIVTHPAYEQTDVATREESEAIDKAIEAQLKRECGDDEAKKKAEEEAKAEEERKAAEEAAKREAEAKAKEEQEARELEEQEQRFREQQAMRLRHRAMRLRTEQELESLSY
jgi:HK97 family phage prohead protease